MLFRFEFSFFDINKRKEIHCNSLVAMDHLFQVQGNKSISRENICSSYAWMTNDVDDPKVTSTSHY